MSLTPEQQKIFEELFTTFNSKGWKIFQEEVKVQFETLRDTSYLTCETNDSWQNQRAEMLTLNKIMNYEDSVRNQYDMLVNEGSNDAEDV